MEVHHFAKPHGVHKAVKSNATRSEVACSRKRLFPTFGIVNEACIFAHFHRYEARARAGRWVKSGEGQILRADTFFLLDVIASRFRLAKHACRNARDYEELVL